MSLVVVVNMAVCASSRRVQNAVRVIELYDFIIVLVMMMLMMMMINIINVMSDSITCWDFNLILCRIKWPLLFFTDIIRNQSMFGSVPARLDGGRI